MQLYRAGEKMPFREGLGGIRNLGAGEEVDLAGIDYHLRDFDDIRAARGF